MKLYHFGIVLSILGISLFVFFYFYGPKAPENNIMINKNTTGWTRESIIITVESSINKDEISAYSFDNGKTWKDVNYITVDNNTVLNIIIKYKNNAKSKMISYSVTQIDRTGPSISFNNNIEVLLNTEFDLLKDVQVEDADSGVEGEIIVDPATIDTSKLGMFEFKYTAIDKLGNVTDAVRTIMIVEELTNPSETPAIQYRYRIKQKETYDCSETKNDTITENPTYVYPDNFKCDGRGYSEVGNNCINISDNSIVKTKVATCNSGFTYNSSTAKCTKTGPVVIPKTCEKETWSEWSAWSNKSVKADENTEVETRNIGE